MFAWKKIATERWIYDVDDDDDDDDDVVDDVITVVIAHQYLHASNRQILWLIIRSLSASR